MKEVVLYVDGAGNPTGETEEKLSAHHATTRKHLAFSCYVFDASGKLLVTKRSSAKKVWAGFWSNSFCGHPQEGEDFVDAIKRRGEYELGVRLRDIQCIKSDYSYQTPPHEGIVENEFCPLFIAHVVGSVDANKDEVENYKWIDFDDYIDELGTETMGDWSWWAKDQLKFVKNNPLVISYVLA
jgi:isopentenyl-diphosphate delta-isomerase